MKNTLMEEENYLITKGSKWKMFKSENILNWKKLKYKKF